ncbi:YraN family protein [Demequina sediminicola]|uniref:YraN family protein n=1 Tax=Demequina sediminicola TaxID=1095026 RepID=UPI0007833B52|nr:YraN family protein [Demequina sediminicola]
MSVTQQVGRYGESVAAQWMQDHGWRVLERNWRCRFGEIDVIAVDGDTLVIAEVKTRRTRSAGLPQEAVTRDKLHRLRALAAQWLHQDPRRWRSVRVDVFAVSVARAGAAKVEHLRGVE